jgi:hypothetical protein
MNGEEVILRCPWLVYTKYKDKDWSFQNEARYLIFVREKKNQLKLKSIDKSTDLDEVHSLCVRLNYAKLKLGTLILGPKMKERTKVEDLVKKYAPSIVIKESKWSGKIR